MIDGVAIVPKQKSAKQGLTPFFLRKTVQWYLNNQTWCQHVQDGSYQRERLGSNE